MQVKQMRNLTGSLENNSSNIFLPMMCCMSEISDDRVQLYSVFTLDRKLYLFWLLTILIFLECRIYILDYNIVCPRKRCISSKQFLAGNSIPVLSPWNPLHLHHIAISLFLWYNVGIPLDTLPYLVHLACYHLRKNIPIILCQSQCILKEITITSKHMNMCTMYIKCIVHPNIKHSWHLCCGKDKQSVLATSSSPIHPNVQCFCFCFVILLSFG